MARGLVVKVGGDVTDFDRAMSRARSVASSASSDIAKRFVESAASINAAFSAGRFLRNAVLGFVAYKAASAVISTAISQAKDSIQEFVDLLDKADRAAVGVEFLQKFSNAAKAARVDAKDVETALANAYEATKPRFEQESSVRKQLSDLFETSYTGQYQSRGLKMFDNATDQEGRVRGVLVAMKELEDLGIRLAAIDVAEKMFGAGFAEKIRTGKIQIDELLNRLDAQQEKQIISQAEAERAKELTFRLDEAKQKLDEALRISELLSAAGRDLYSAWVQIVEVIAKGAEGLAKFQTKLSEIIGKAIDPAKMQVSTLMTEQTTLETRLRDTGLNSLQRKNLEAQLRAVQGKMQLEQDANPVIPPPNMGPTSANVPLPPRRPLSVVLNPPKPERAAAGSSPSETVSSVERLAIQMEKAAQLAETELKTLGLSNVEKAKALALVEAEAAAKRDVAAGLRDTVDLTEQEKSRLLAAAGATAEWRERVRQVQDAMETVKDITGDALKGFISDLRQGKSAADALKSAMDRILDSVTSKLIDNALSGIFGGGSSGGAATSFFSGLFGGARAGGGSVAGGTAYLVGERGPELFVPGRSGTIVPNGIGGGGGGGSVVNVVVQNNAGAEIGVKQSRGPNGLDIQLVVEQAVLKSMAGGAIGRQMASYGFNRMNAR